MTPLPTFEADHRSGLHNGAPCEACAICKITAGDVVRLRDGTTITVDSRIDWYQDATGRHEGPFAVSRPITNSYDAARYALLSDVVEVVAKNPRVCVFCGEGVTATNAETDFCRNCFYSGRAAERQLAPLIDRIDALDEVAQNTAVWHSGGGCFNLAVRLADGRLLTPSVGYEGDGTIWAEPGFPDPDDPEARWAMVVSDSEEAWSEWDETKLWTPQALYTDDELVAAIREVALKSDEALARALREAESAGDDDAVATALNDLCFRLSLPLDETEQGLTQNASDRIDAFVRDTLDREEEG